MWDAVGCTDAELLSKFELEKLPTAPSWLGSAPAAPAARVVLPPDVPLIDDVCALLAAVVDKAGRIPAFEGEPLATLLRHQQAVQRALTRCARE